MVLKKLRDFWACDGFGRIWMFGVGSSEIGGLVWWSV